MEVAARHRVSGGAVRLRIRTVGGGVAAAAMGMAATVATAVTAIAAIAAAASVASVARARELDGTALQPGERHLHASARHGVWLSAATGRCKGRCKGR